MASISERQRFYTQALQAQMEYQQNQQYQQVWAENTTTTATYSNGAVSFFANAPTITYLNTPVFPAKPKEPTNLDWLDQRVNEMRVRL